MIQRTEPAIKRSAPAPRRLRRACAWSLLAGVTLLASGCGANLFGHRIGVADHKQAAAKPKSHADEHAAVVPPSAQDRALEARERAMAEPQEPYWPYRLGQLQWEADSLPAAEAALKASLTRERTYAPSLALLSKLYFDSGRHQEAITMLEPVRSQPDAFTPETRQVLLAGLALHQDALGHLDLAESLVPTSGHADMKRAGSAMVYVMLRGEHPDAAEAPAVAALDAGKNAVNLNNFGITRLRAGDPPAARKAFLSAIERDPTLPGPYYNLAILEKYFLFDDAAASRWFSAYWKRSQADPDSLIPVFSSAIRGHLAETGEPDR